MKALRGGAKAGTRGKRLGAAPHPHPRRDLLWELRGSPVFHTSATWGHFHPTHTPSLAHSACALPRRRRRARSITHALLRAGTSNELLCSCSGLLQAAHLVHRSQLEHHRRVRRACCMRRGANACRLTHGELLAAANSGEARAAAAAAHDDASFTRSLRACCHESARS